VEIFDNFNTFSSNITINVAPSPIFTITPGPSIVACPLDSVVLTPSNFYPGSDYYWSNGAVSETITIGTTGIGFEIRTLNLIITNSQGCSFYDTVTIVFDFASCSGVFEAKENSILKAYPNPTTGEITVEFPADFELEKLEVLDIQGRMIRTFPVAGSSKESKLMTIDLSDEPEGVYFLRAARDRTIYYQKIILTRD
jgi:hypothetical protein